jgi:CheY-like chemotaxis protein
VSQSDVLLLDDDDLVRVPLVEILEEKGFSVLSTGDPLEALLRLRGLFPPWLLLTDIDLDVVGLDGFEVARLARLHTPALPVIFMSGRVWLLDQHSVGRTDRMLPKPFRGGQLLQFVRELQIARPAG